MPERILYRLLPWLAAPLPSRVLVFLSRRTADCFYLFAGRARRTLTDNLRPVLGPATTERELRRTARQAFESFGEYLGEFFGGRRHGAESLTAAVELEGLEHLDAVLAAGRGALLCSGHYSNWELGAAVLGRRGYPLTALTSRYSTAEVNALFVRERRSWGVEVVHSGGGTSRPGSANGANGVVGVGGVGGAGEAAAGARAVLRALRRNRAVAVLADRSTGGPTVTVKLRGRPTRLPQGPWRLAEKSGAPLLPTFVHRRASRRYVLSIGAPLPEPPRAAKREERLLFRARAWTASWEERLRADPAQWAAFFPVWENEAEAVEAAAVAIPLTGTAGEGTEPPVTAVGAAVERNE